MAIEATGILEERRHKWKSKEILRKLYHKWYSLIGEWIKPGVVLELGGGSGNLKESFPHAISSDIVFAPWVDAVLDAQRLPFRKASIDSIVLFDVLHHLSAPALFFSEAERILKVGGKVVMIEPYVSCSSFLVYKFLHQEGLELNGNPLRYGYEGRRDPFRGNQAVPRLIFAQYRKDFLRKYPNLRIVNEQKMDFIAYPLSGGFHHSSLLPSSLYHVFESIETCLRPLSSYLAFRVFLVLQKEGRR